MSWLQFTRVLACVVPASRRGGVGLLIMAFGFATSPSWLPIGEMLIILAVVTAASALQAAG